MPDHQELPPRLSFAVFDEFGKGADDRVQDYGQRCFEAGKRSAPAVSGEAVAYRTRYRSEPGMIGHYPWSYTERKPRFPNHEKTIEVEPLYAHPTGEVEKDAARLDWLCRQFVTVRIPLRYGSRECFMGSPDDGDGDSLPWDIRAAIDAAMNTEAKNG